MANPSDQTDYIAGFILNIQTVISNYQSYIGYKILEAVESGNITDVGLLFDQHWEYKKKISSQMKILN